MLRLLTLAFVTTILLTGCNSDLKVEVEDTPTQIDTSDINAESVSLAPVGEACGSKIETLCAEGLFCDYSAGEKTGICTQKEVNPNITCDKTKEPVCGQKGRQRLGYLNECEARRHGAEILNTGFCQPEDIADSCAHKIYSLGNCGDEFNGVEYNSTEDECVKINVRGCEAQLPFETLEACETTCLK